MHRDRDSRAAGRGQGLVEFSLVLPVFMLMVFGIVDVGRAVWANNTVANAAREAARFAVVHGGTETNACPVGPPGPDANFPAASSSCPYPSPSKEGIYSVARNFMIAGGTGTIVQVCYGTGCSGDTDTPSATNVRGTPVTVTVSSQVPMIVGNFIGVGTANVSATSTMLVNH